MLEHEKEKKDLPVQKAAEQDNPPYRLRAVPNSICKQTRRSWLAFDKVEGGVYFFSDYR